MHILRSLLLFVPASLAMAQNGYETHFENLAATATGVAVAGADGLFVPPTTPASVDGVAYTYAGNLLGVPGNPIGISKFLALVGATGAPAQLERLAILPVDCEVHIEFDICVLYTGATAPSGDIGGFTLQPTPAARTVGLVARWPAGAGFPPTTWDADVAIGPSAGGATVQHAHPQFQGLLVGNWYRYGCGLDLAAGHYTLFKIVDRSTGATTVYLPPPGTMPIVNPSGSPPTAFRLSALGDGSVVCIDSLSVAIHASYHPFGAGCPGALGTPVLAPQNFSRPVMGGTLNANLFNLPTNFGLVVLGFSDTLSGPFALPLDLGFFDMPGCSLLTDIESSYFLVGSGGVATWSVQVPTSILFMGLFFYNQGFSFDTTANLRGVAASNGLVGCIGR